MSNHGLYVRVLKIPCVLSIALLLSDKSVTLALRIWLFLSPPTHNHPLPEGSWHLPSRRCESWHTSAIIIIIPALAVVNDIVWGWLEKAGLFAWVRCQHNRKRRKRSCQCLQLLDLIGRGNGIKIFKLPCGIEMRGYCLITQLSLAWSTIKGVRKRQVPLSHEG